MPDQTGLRTALDNTGNAYPAIRPRTCQYLTGVPVGNPVTTAPFQPQTKVVRICSEVDVSVIIAGIAGQIVIGAGVYQDFIVWPGDSLQIAALSAGGDVSVAELL